MEVHFDDRDWSSGCCVGRRHMADWFVSPSIILMTKLDNIDITHRNEGYVIIIKRIIGLEGPFLARTNVNKISS